MNSAQINTIIKILESNKIFLNSINNEAEIIADDIVLTQLIALYININSETFNTLDINNKDEILFMLNTHNYIIEEDKIKNENTILSLKELLEIFLLIKNKKNKSLSPKNIFVDFTSKTEPIEKKYEPTIIYYDFKNANRINNDNRRREFAIDQTILSASGYAYTKDVERNFVMMIEKIIDRIINNDYDEIDYADFKFVYALINNYTVLNYLNHKLEIPLNCLYSNRGNIAITKLKYDDEYINELEKIISELEKKASSLETRIMNLSYYEKYNQELLKALSKSLEKIRFEEERTGILLYELKNEKHSLLTALINSIIICINQTHVELRTTPRDPYITLFYLESCNLESMFEMHLSSFAEFIDNEEMIKYLKTSRKSLIKKAE